MSPPGEQKTKNYARTAVYELRKWFRIHLRFFILGTMLGFIALIAWMFKQQGEYAPPTYGLVYCSEGSPETFNPQLGSSGTTFDATSHQLYDGLITLDAGGNVLPGLAYRWNISRDRKTYTFKLRQGVSFHQTSYFNPSRFLEAKDVVFSFKRMLDKEHQYHQVNGGRYPYFQSLAMDTLILDVVAVDARTVKFELLRPDSSFLINLSTDFAVILSEEYGMALLEQESARLIDIRPIGTGPFKFFDYRKDSYIKYRRHDNYWNKRAHIERLVFDITPKSSVRMTKLLTGECDVIAYPAAVELDIISRSDKLRLSVKTDLNVGYLAFNTLHQPFDKPKVRKAISHAINRAAILEAVYYGTATIANSMLPPVSWAYNASLPPVDFDPEYAKDLLVEAGLDKGFEFDLWVMPLQRVYNPSPRKTAQLIKSNLDDINVKVDLIHYDWYTFQNRIAAGEHDAVLLGWMADTPDPDNFFRPMLSCQALSLGINEANWCNFEFDQLLDLALRTQHRDIRKKYYGKAQQIMHEEMPLLYIAHAQRLQAQRSDVVGLSNNPFGGISFARAYRKH